MSFQASGVWGVCLAALPRTDPECDINNTFPPMVSAKTSQELHSDSSHTRLLHLVVHTIHPILLDSGRSSLPFCEAFVMTASSFYITATLNEDMHEDHILYPDSSLLGCFSCFIASPSGQRPALSSLVKHQTHWKHKVILFYKWIKIRSTWATFVLYSCNSWDTGNNAAEIQKHRKKPFSHHSVIVCIGFLPCRLQSTPHYLKSHPLRTLRPDLLGTLWAATLAGKQTALPDQQSPLKY